MSNTHISASDLRVSVNLSADLLEITARVERPGAHGLFDGDTITVKGLSSGLAERLFYALRWASDPGEKIPEELTADDTDIVKFVDDLPNMSEDEIIKLIGGSK